jgi:hypothetical protein
MPPSASPGSLGPAGSAAEAHSEILGNVYWCGFGERLAVPCLADVLRRDLEIARRSGILPIRASPARISSHTRSAASSKSGASAGRICQFVVPFPNN